MKIDSSLQMRVVEAFTWLKRNRGMLQKDVAAKMGTTETTISRNIKACGERTNERFLFDFNAAADNVFNMDWLLTGEGSMMAAVPIHTIKKDEPTPISPSDEIINLAARLIAENEALRRELQDTLADVRMLRKELATANSSIQSAVATLNAATTALRSSSIAPHPDSLAKSSKAYPSEAADAFSSATHPRYLAESDTDLSDKA